MVFFIKLGTKSLLGTLIFIPISILIVVLLPIVIMAVLAVAVVAGSFLLLTSKTKKKPAKIAGKKVIDAEYKIK